LLCSARGSSGIGGLQAAAVESAGNFFPAAGGRLYTTGADFASRIIGSCRNTAATGLD
jgi:hypothetical protein